MESMAVSRPKNALTLVLRNYARPANMIQIISVLRQQSIQPTLFVWDNSGKPFDVEADWLIKSSKNVHGSAFTYLARQAITPFVGRMDDDLIPTDNDVLADAIKVLMEADYSQIVGAYGVNLIGKSYQDGHHINTPSVDTRCDIIKGRLMLFRRDLFLDGTIAAPINPITHHVDLELSFGLAEQRRHYHLVSKCFYRRLAELSTKASVSYGSMPRHYYERDGLATRWLDS